MRNSVFDLFVAYLKDKVDHYSKSSVGMKQSILIIAYIGLLLTIAGCVQRDKSKIIEKYKYEENINQLPGRKDLKLESWVKEGVDCFGLIMVCEITGDPIRMKEVYVKVVSIQPDSLRIEALEDVMINRVQECKKVNLKKGQRWNETYGEIFRTRADAINYIDSRYPGLRVKY